MRGHGFLTGAYIRGNSPLHKAPVGLKVIALLLISILALSLTSTIVLSALLVVTALLYIVARLPWSRLGRTLQASAPVVVVLGAFQWWLAGPVVAWHVVAIVLCTILASGLLTGTTEHSAVLDALARWISPLRRLGADPERFALTVSVMLRSLPFIVGSFQDVRDAARARGLEHNVRARTLPVLITTVAYARQTGEAMMARGLGDDDELG
ncbi:MAG: energy-coupling factor transporter transmembrane protein EcfT [Acidobacteria bacterium]|nr:energy-coupling factor transporter transmembrane protein EcfT [Acidobacteriota bacterium]